MNTGKGGYKIIDFGGIDIESDYTEETPVFVKIDGIYEAIENNYGKPFCFANVVYSEVERNDEFVNPIVVDGLYTFRTSYGLVQINPDDEIITTAPYDISLNGESVSDSDYALILTSFQLGLPVYFSYGSATNERVTNYLTYSKKQGFYIDMFSITSSKLTVTRYKISKESGHAITSESIELTPAELTQLNNKGEY